MSLLRETLAEIARLEKRWSTSRPPAGLTWTCNACPFVTGDHSVAVIHARSGRPCAHRLFVREEQKQPRWRVHLAPDGKVLTMRRS